MTGSTDNEKDAEETPSRRAVERRVFADEVTGEYPILPEIMVKMQRFWELICDNLGGAETVGVRGFNKLAGARGDFIEACNRGEAPMGEEVAAIRSGIRANLTLAYNLLGSLSLLERLNLPEDVEGLEPMVPYFLYSFATEVERVLGKEAPSERLLELWEGIRFVHAQALAMELKKVYGPLLGKRRRGQFSIAEVGAGSGDCISRMLHEWRISETVVAADAFDTVPQPLLALKYDRSRNRSLNYRAVPVREGDLLTLSSDVKGKSYDAVNISNVMHKIDPDRHEDALREAISVLDRSRTSYVVLNFPYYHSHMTRIEKGYKECDGTNHPDALKRWTYWRDLSNKVAHEYGGFISNEVRLGFKVSHLDHFRHRVLVLEIPALAS